MTFAPTLTIQALLTLAQIVVALAVGWVAFQARQDAKRNSVAGLLKHVTDSKVKIVEDYINCTRTVYSPTFANEAPKIRRFHIDMFERVCSTKRGLDIAEQKLLSEADAAWGLGKSLQCMQSDLNPETDAEHNKMFKELREKFLPE